MLKGKPRNVAEGAGPDGQSYRDNPRVNAKIDAWIKANPKHWAYIESLPPDRMARALALNEVQKHERTQKFDDGVMRKLNENPEAKQAYETLVKHLPEDQREKAMVSIARQTMRMTGRQQAQRRPQSNGVSA